MARKKTPTQSMSDQFLDWFEDQADENEQEYVLNYLARLQRRGNGRQIATGMADALDAARGAAKTTRKPRATGAEAKSEKQAKVSKPVHPELIGVAPTRRTGFGGGPVSAVAGSAKVSEGEAEVDTE